MYAVFGLALALLVLYIALRKPDRMQYTLPEITPLSSSAITAITVQQGAAEAVRLSKQGENWVVGPRGFRADPAAVSAMVSALSDFRLSDLVSTTQSYERYELDVNKAISVIARDDEKVVRAFSLGKRAPSLNHTYVLMDGDVNVYHAAADLRRIFDKDIAALRDRKVFTINKDEVVRVGLKRGEWSLQVFKPTTTVSTEGQTASAEKWQTSDGGTWDAAEVDSLVSGIANLSCTSFSEGSLTDLGKPELIIEVETAEAQTLSLYEKTADGYLATSSQNPYLFFISEQVGDVLFAAVSGI